MLKKERQNYIMQKLNLHNKVLSSSLSAEIDVSEDTVRRDLQELSDQGQLIKVHGGALSKSFGQMLPPNHTIYAHDEKKIIASKAIQLIQEGMFILTGGGTTIVEMARLLPYGLQATFITGSMAAILEYMEHPQIDVIVIGDKISRSSKITVGSDAIAKVRQINADICFLGANAIDMEHGITDNDWEVVQLKKAMIESSKKVVCLSISEKINSVQPLKVCDITQIDTLVTELNPNVELLRPYNKLGIHIL